MESSRKLLIFVPGFQKHAGRPCQGVEIHLTDRDSLHALLLGMVVLEAAYRCDPENFGWRAEPYEFVSDPPAIDLLTGDERYRLALESGAPIHPLLEQWEPERQEFLGRRESCLLY